MGGIDPILVSVLSPIFNESKHLEEMIASVRAQSHANFELILVDDGSTDDTVTKARLAQSLDPRIRVIDEGKLGKVGAFNRAFAESTGDVIVLMGGDDVMPPESLAVRADAVRQAVAGGAQRVAVFARLQTMSENRKFDGQLIPRSRRKGARSGGTLALSRELARVAFPIPQRLVAEDLWIGGIAGALADAIVDLPDVVLRYRIHDGNSNPRNRDFATMTEAMHARMLAYRLLAEVPVLAVPAEPRRRFQVLAELEERRHAGDLFGLLAHSEARLTDKLRAASMATPLLFQLRTSLFRLFSGW
ncbi:glycosyltransferase family 2 protein [Microbacterium sp.]|uniref:glycosyltransferase family 2 protein n=1 Tax=Microbacterium sp. TaxID=51671 RepID=UPI00281258CF|nr:glycosyltransferase [Microbacterium sp.]